MLLVFMKGVDGPNRGTVLPPNPPYKKGKRIMKISSKAHNIILVNLSTFLIWHKTSLNLNNGIAVYIGKTWLLWL